MMLKKTKLIRILLLLVSTSLCNHLNAQADTIIKLTKEKIICKVLEVGTNAISYKKASNPDGPTYVENKMNIVKIIYSNGQVEHYNSVPVNTSKNTSSAATNSASTVAPTNSMTKDSSMNQASTQPSDGKIKIEMADNKYTINGQKASRKDVDRQLATSKNPLVIMPLKAAKMTKTAQKIVKITSIPASIGGGFATLVSVIDLYNDARRHRDNTSTYVNFGLSLVGTLTLPITNKILKKKSNNMYSKIIDAYNLTN